MESYLKENKLTLLLVFASVLTGAIIGAFSVLKLDSETAATIYSALNENAVRYGIFSAFLKSLFNEFKRFIILFVCGITVFGSPVCVASLWNTGYVLGFSAGFLMRYYGLSGILASLLGIVPHYIILLPAYLCVGIVSINFSSKLLRGERNIKRDFKNYAVKMLFFAVIIFTGCVFEGFVSSYLIKKILTIIIN